MTNAHKPTSIWYGQPTTADLNKLKSQTLLAHLAMEFVEVGDDYLIVEMPVDERTVQPYGLLHGGASAALAETAGSVASGCVIDPETEACVGIELNCSHLSGARSGTVRGTCRPLRIGRRLHVWEIKIVDVAQRLVCVARLTVAIIEQNKVHRS